MGWSVKRRCWRHSDPGCDVKICVIGTSHLGALKLGWDMVRGDFPDLELVFFGSPGTSLRQMRTKGTRLVADDEELARNLAFTSGGLSEIVIAEHDAFLLCGVLFRFPRLRRGVSVAVLQEAVQGLASKGLLIRTAKRMRRLTSKRLWLSANPLEMAPDDCHEAAEFHSYDMLLGAVQRAFVVPDVVFLPQPAETIGPDLRAPARFGVGSQKLLPNPETGDSEAHAAKDVAHMNGEFGKLWLQANLPVIRAHTLR